MIQVLSPFQITNHLLEATPPDGLKNFALGVASHEGGFPLEGLPVYDEYAKIAGKLEGRRRGKLKLASNTWLIQHSDKITLRLHETDILTWLPDNSVIVDVDGYRSKTSLERLWYYLPIGGWNIYAKTKRGENADFGPSYERNVNGQVYAFSVRIGDWFWYNRAMDAQRENPKYHRIQPYMDGDRIDSNGTLHPQAPPVFRKRGKFLKPNVPEQPAQEEPPPPVEP